MSIREFYYQNLTLLEGVLYLYADEDCEDYKKYTGSDLGITHENLLAAWNRNRPARQCADFAQLFQKGEKSFKTRYIDKITPGDVHLFTLVNWQIRGFENKFKRFNLDKYIVHRSAMASNINYPDRDPLLCLQVIVLHYKDFVK